MVAVLTSRHWRDLVAATGPGEVADALERALDASMPGLGGAVSWCPAGPIIDLLGWRRLLWAPVIGLVPGVALAWWIVPHAAPRKAAVTAAVIPPALLAPRRRRRGERETGPGAAPGPVPMVRADQNDSTARRASGSRTPQPISSSVSSVGDLS